MFAIRPSITFITRRRLLSTALSMSIIKTIPPTATVSKDTLPDLLYLLRCDMSEQVRHLKCKKMDVSIWEHLYSSKVNDQFSSWVAAGFNQRLIVKSVPILHHFFLFKFWFMFCITFLFNFVYCLFVYIVSKNMIVYVILWSVFNIFKFEYDCFYKRDLLFVFLLNGKESLFWKPKCLVYVSFKSQKNNVLKSKNFVCFYCTSQQNIVMKIKIFFLWMSKKTLLCTQTLLLVFLKWPKVIVLWCKKCVVCFSCDC